MVKFGDKLAKHRFQEWERYYVGYDRLKRKLNETTREGQTPVFGRLSTPFTNVREPLISHTLPQIIEAHSTFSMESEGFHFE